MDAGPISQPRPDAALADRPGRGAQFVAALGDEAQKRARTRDLRPLRRLIPYATRRPVELAMATVFLVLAAASTLVLPVAARVLVDNGLSLGDPAQINRYFLLLVAVAVSMAVFSASRFYFVTRLGERIVADLRADVYDRLIGLSPSFFARTRTGEALSRLTVDATLVETLVSSSASMALRNVLMMAGGLVMLFATSAKLAGLVLLIIPAVLVPLVLVGRHVRTLSATAQDRIADAAAEASESLDAVETVQAFGQEARARRRFRNTVEESYRAALRRTGVRALMTALAISIVFGGIALVLWEGATSVLEGRMTPGAMTQFVFLALLTASGAGALTEVWGDVQKAAGATQRLAEILDETPDIAAPAAPAILPFPTRGAVAFEDVSFAYPSDAARSAVRHLNFEIRPGEHVALVGPSGAGKSTIFRLLLRFYDPQSGAITLDGIDARSVDPHEWRARFALVSQNPDLFSGTAAENIAFGSAHPSEAAILDAARRAEAEPFVLARLGGFDRTIGDRGRALSGGERQRLAIARALVRDAPVLLLDEATSALDAENERLVQKAFSTAMEDRTTLVIAHRLATVRRADRILVVDGGAVVEQGSHDELVARGGLYARLARLQFDDIAFRSESPT